MDSAGTAWHAVKHGNLEVGGCSDSMPSWCQTASILQLITKLFPSQCNVYAKGPVGELPFMYDEHRFERRGMRDHVPPMTGENVFHIAMLLNTPSTLAIAKFLVRPSCCMCDAAPCLTASASRMCGPGEALRKAARQHSLPRKEERQRCAWAL